MRAYSACSLSSLIHPCCFGSSGAGWPGEPGSKLIAGQLLGNADAAADVPCSSCPAAPNDPSSNRGAGSDLPRARVSAFTASSSSLLMLLLFVSPRDCAVSRSNLETPEEAVRFGECLALGTAPSNKRGSSNSETVAEALLLLLRVHMHADTHIIALVTWLYPWLNTVAHIHLWRQCMRNNRGCVHDGAAVRDLTCVRITHRRVSTLPSRTNTRPQTRLVSQPLVHTPECTVLFLVLNDT